MIELALAAGAALWLGVLTSISPCPLATNIAAISFIGRRVDRPDRAFWTGLVYTSGRMAAYVALAALLVAGLLAAPALSHGLQTYMNKLLGPILVLAGMFLLELLTLGRAGGGMGAWVQRLGERGDLWGAGMLGIIFALSFCPVSAALFFGSLLPLAVRFESSLLLPSLYGLGTGLPVFAFGLMIALGMQSLGRVYNQIARFEPWMRRLTGGVFIIIGCYYILRHTLVLF